MLALNVMRLARAALAAVLVLGLGGAVVAAVAPHAHGLDPAAALAGRFAGLYGVTLLAILAFPRSRRRDLALALAVLAALGEAALGVLGADFRIADLAADFAGVAALWAPTEFEAVRRRMRERPDAPAFGRVRSERRRASDQPGWTGLIGAGRAPLAALLLVGIVFATLCPPGLRPHLASAQLERFGAYLLAAAAFVAAFPRRPWIIALAAVLVAVGLEFGQLLVPGRDAGLPDAIAKALGGLTGVAAASLAMRLRAARLIPARVAARSR